MKFALAILLLSSFSTYALDVHYGLEIHQSGEYTDISKQDLKAAGCESVVENDDDGMICTLSGVVSESDLPFSFEVGDAYFSISKDGEVTLGLSYGDADGGADGVLTLPQGEGGELLPMAPLKLNVSGSDNASGSWYFNATARVSVE